jgi:dipeptidyl aminopeptidase/acylaminoacyl peptidase
VSKDPARDEDPAWSPDGATLLFASNRDGDFEIYAANPDGSNLRQLTRNFVTDRYPSYSPDGKRIVYSSTATGSLDIWSMNADGSEPKQLTTAAGLDELPSYSPDGTSIVFASERTGLSKIWIMAADGSGQRMLVQSAFYDWSPAFKVDGRFVLFERFDGSDSEIYAVDITNGAVTNITVSPSSSDRYPAPSPDGLVFAYATDAPAPARDSLVNARHDLHFRVCGSYGAEACGSRPPQAPYDYDPFRDPRAPLLRHLAGGVAADYAPAWQTVQAGDTTLSLTGPASVRRGKVAAYRLTAGSIRTSLETEDVVVGLTVPRAAATVALDAACRRSGTRVRCELGSLAPWSERTLVLRFRAPNRVGPITLRATIAGALPELDPANNRAAKTTAVK